MPDELGEWTSHPPQATLRREEEQDSLMTTLPLPSHGGSAPVPGTAAARESSPRAGMSVLAGEPPKAFLAVNHGAVSCEMANLNYP